MSTILDFGLMILDWKKEVAMRAMPSQAPTQWNAARPGARSNRSPKSEFQNKERGAAFLIAIAILVILVAIGTTFFSVSRLELKTATNVTNAVRVDLLNDAANAIAIHHLNQYFFRNPEVTSQDHSYRSLFDGSFVVGKSWARNKKAGSTIGENSFVGEMSVLQAHACLGNNVWVWSGNLIGHDVSMGDHCFISSHVVIGGNAKVGQRCFFGMNATVRDGIVVADECVIGAQAWISKNTEASGVYAAPPTAKYHKRSDEVKI